MATEKAMDIQEALRGRKTIRGFLAQAVPQQLIREILIDAHWAPSSSNQQPWHFHVVTGPSLEALCENIQEARRLKQTSYDPSKGKTIPPEYVDRTKKLFKQILPFISSLDGDNKSFIESGSFRFYGAPVAIFITMHASLPKSRYMDIGMAAQNLMLSAHGRGLGTCAIALTLYYGEAINASLGIDAETNQTLLCLALGYPDDACPVNRFRSSREDIDPFITWAGF
jgi:nitroreductase